MKYLTDIIKEQNQLLREASEAIDALMAENERLEKIVASGSDADLLSPNKIKAMLMERGITAAAIGRALTLDRVTVSVVINGYGKSKRIQQYIADALGVEFKYLWGNNHKKAA